MVFLSNFGTLRVSLLVWAVLSSAACFESTVDRDQKVPILLEAIRLGSEAQVRNLISEGVPVDGVYNAAANMPVPIWWGESSITFAASEDNASIVGLLLEEGASPDARNYRGETPLIKAARNPTTDVLDLLIKHGADVNLPSAEGYTPLMMASIYGNVAASRVLLNSSANANVERKAVADVRRHVFLSDVDSALSLALTGGHSEVVSLLLKSGTSPSLESVQGAENYLRREGREQHRLCLELVRTAKAGGVDENLAQEVVQRSVWHLREDLFGGGLNPEQRELIWQTKWVGKAVWVRDCFLEQLNRYEAQCSLLVEGAAVEGSRVLATLAMPLDDSEYMNLRGGMHCGFKGTIYEKPTQRTNLGRGYACVRHYQACLDIYLAEVRLQCSR